VVQVAVDASVAQGGTTYHCDWIPLNWNKDEVKAADKSEQSDGPMVQGRGAVTPGCSIIRVVVRAHQAGSVKVSRLVACVAAPIARGWPSHSVVSRVALTFSRSVCVRVSVKEYVEVTPIP
jgi:hypothetical protein